jgi:hypothetical protein
MMTELDREVLENASLAKDPFEVVAVGLIFQQQKIIGELMRLIKATSRHLRSYISNPYRS